MKYNFVFNFSNFLLKIASKLKITLVYDVVKLPIYDNIILFNIRPHAT